MINIPIELIVLSITFIVGAIGWFVKILVVNIKELTIAINDFRTAIALLQEENKNINLSCSSKHSVIDKRLNEHSSKIGAHGILIAEHEIKIKELQKKSK